VTFVKKSVKMVFAMGEAMIFVVDSDEAVGQCDDEDMRKLEALAANESDEQVSTCRQTDLDLSKRKQCVSRLKYC